MSRKSGQTSVEYLLLLLVAVTIIVSSMTHVRAFFGKNVTECDEDTKGFACTIVRALRGTDGGNGRKFEFFQVRK